MDVEKGGAYSQKGTNKSKYSQMLSPKDRNKLRGVSFEGITREYRDKILVSRKYL
jgi:hypothetical protein